MKNAILILVLMLPYISWAQMSSLSYQSKDNGSYTSGAYQSTSSNQNFIVGTWYSNVNAQSANYKTSTSMPSGFTYILCADIQISVDGSTSFCQGDSVTLSVDSAFENYLWSNNSTEDQIIVSTTNPYHLVVTDSVGCVSKSDTIFVQMFNTAVPSITRSGDSLITELAQTYQWFFNGTIIPDAESNIYTPTLFGNYEVQVSDSNSCSEISEAFNYQSTGIDLSVITDFKFYPNPASNLLTIEGEIIGDKIQVIEIRSLLGQLIIQKKINKQTTHFSKVLDISNLSDGYYLIMLKSDDKLLNTSKLIKTSIN